MANSSLKNLKNDFRVMQDLFKSTQEKMDQMDRLSEATFFKFEHSVNLDLFQEIENINAMCLNQILSIVQVAEIIKERAELKIRNQLKLRYQLEVKKLNEKLKEINEYEKSNSKKTNQKRSKILLFNLNLLPNIYDIDTNGKKSYRKQYTAAVGRKKFFVFHERNHGSDYYFNFNFYFDICAQNLCKKSRKCSKIKAPTGKSSNNSSCSSQPKSKCKKFDCFSHLFSRIKYGKKGYSILKNEPSLSSLSM